MTKELAEELREYTAMKYAGDCKCGKCQLVPRALVERIYHTLNSTPAQGAQVRRQYYFRVNGCQADHSGEPACTCWHDEGTGPLSNQPSLIQSWRDKPAPPAPASEPVAWREALLAAKFELEMHDAEYHKITEPRVIALIDAALATPPQAQAQFGQKIGDEQIEEAILQFARERGRSINLTYDSGTYEITKPTGAATNLAKAILALTPSLPSPGVRADKADYKIGSWLSAALEDPSVCAEMKADINEWFEAHQPGLKMPPLPSTEQT